MNTDENTDDISRRAAIYRILARVFGDAPDTELLDNLKKAGIFEQLQKAGYFPKKMLDIDHEDLADELGPEYTRLFVGPTPQAPPYGSLYLEPKNDENRLWGPSTAGVKQFMETCGLKLNNNHGSIPDHLSIELEFMAHLVEAETNNKNKKNNTKNTSPQDIQAAFLNNYLVPWTNAFAEKVEHSHPHDFYAGFVRFTRDWLQSEQQNAPAT